MIVFFLTGLRGRHSNDGGGAGGGGGGHGVFEFNHPSTTANGGVGGGRTSSVRQGGDGGGRILAATIIQAKDLSVAFGHLLDEIARQCDGVSVLVSSDHHQAGLLLPGLPLLHRFLTVFVEVEIV